MDLVRLVIDALALRSDAFAAVLELGRPGARLALLVVFVGGLSTALGQSVILFANRVSPRRFLASLVVQALLFVIAFLLWVAAVWLVAAVLGHPLTFGAAVTAVGLAHAPLVFGFLVLAPYFGTPIATVLSIWTLLSTLLATATAFGISAGEAALAAGLGWLLSQLAQRSVGRPITRLGRMVRHAVAGVELRHVRPP